MKKVLKKTELVQKIRVLCVEDSALDRELIRHALEKEARNFVMIEASDRETFEKLLAEGDFDMVLTDFNILGFDGLEVIREVKKRHPEAPVIVVTGTGSEEIAVQSLKEGAEDYIIKKLHNIAQLPNTILRVMEAKENRTRLREREANIRALAENTADGIVLVDRQGYVVFSNPAAERLFGYSSGELVGTLFGYSVENRKFLEIDLPHRSGGPGNAEMSVSETVWDGGVCSIVAMRDVTERKRSELMLKESDERHRAILQTAMDGIWITDMQGCLLNVNIAYCLMSGYSEQELLAMRISDIEVVESAAEVESHIRKVMEQGEERFETRQRRKDGGIFDAEVSTIYLQGEGGRIVAFMRDITDRKRTAEELLRMSEKLKKALVGTIQAMARTVDVRDPYTAGHQRRVAGLAAAIAAEMHLSPETIEALTMAGFVHDIGKVSIPSEILSKPGRLSLFETDVIREHPRHGYEILKEVESPWQLGEITYQHHERMDGSGYPSGLRGEAIMLEARILAVADVVEAMVSHRPYRPSLGVEAALEEIEQNRGILYDPAVVDACLVLFRKKGFQLPEA
ncbi:MAG: PAS domain S-box protein [Thermovirgaceae bacterium]|nr:PAS domain S-box protein [Thermovirgaceae bacterium]